MIKRPVIICVDDERTILDALKEQINRYFKREYYIECAENGEQALEIFKAYSEENVEVPVIVSDLIMPGMKGDELLKEIFLINPRSKKILLTGQADADAVGRAVNFASLYRYIPKPWEQLDLMLTLQEALRSYYLDKSLEEKNQELSQINHTLQESNEKLVEKMVLFNKFVPEQFLKVLKIDILSNSSLNTEEYIKLSQSAERELTIVFADIRSFTTICEKLTSQGAFDFINNYLSEICPIITAHDGFIDKYMGDAVMALFLDPDQAVSAAVEIQDHLLVYNQKLISLGQESIEVGIGINTDTVMIGTVGESNRLQTTVIGDAVNLSQRTENKSKEFHSKIVITQNTFQKLKNSQAYRLRFLDRASVKGKKQILNFYAVIPSQSNFSKEAEDLYEKGVEAFHLLDYQKAQDLFEACLKIEPQDYPAQYLLKMCQKAGKVTYDE